MRERYHLCPTVGNGIAIERGYDEVVDALQQRSIRAFSFAAGIGAECSCDDVSPGWLTRYGGRPPIPEATDATAFNLDLVTVG